MTDERQAMDTTGMLHKMNAGPSYSLDWGKAVRILLAVHHFSQNDLAKRIGDLQFACIALGERSPSAQRGSDLSLGGGAGGAAAVAVAAGIARRRPAAFGRDRPGHFGSGRGALEDAGGYAASRR